MPVRPALANLWVEHNPNVGEKPAHEAVQHQRLGDEKNRASCRDQDENSHVRDLACQFRSEGFSQEQAQPQSNAKPTGSDFAAIAI